MKQKFNIGDRVKVVSLSPLTKKNKIGDTGTVLQGDCEIPVVKMDKVANKGVFGGHVFFDSELELI